MGLIRWGKLGLDPPHLLPCTADMEVLLLGANSSSNWHSYCQRLTNSCVSVSSSQKQLSGTVAGAVCVLKLGWIEIVWLVTVGCFSAWFDLVWGSNRPLALMFSLCASLRGFSVMFACPPVFHHPGCFMLFTRPICSFQISFTRSLSLPVFLSLCLP